MSEGVNSFLNEQRYGLIFNLQRFCVHDGPGIRTTVFMKGCPLSCRWCSNPESINPYPELMTYDRRCILCERCVEVCSKRAITVNRIRKVNRLRCDLCLKCVNVCPTGAIKAAGQFMTIEEVLLEVKKDELFYQNSCGGITISGGEPLFQWKFVRRLLKECQQEGIHTALDTSGYVQWDMLRKVLEYTDLCLFDLKHPEPGRHMWGTGKSNRRIIENLYLTASGTRTWLRVPIIPQYNDSEEDIKNLIGIAKKSNVEKVSLLLYHDYAKGKYKSLGRHYRLGKLSPLRNDRLPRLEELFRNAKIDVTIGY